MLSPIFKGLFRALYRLSRMPLRYAMLRLEAEIWRRASRRPPGYWEKKLDIDSLLQLLGERSWVKLLGDVAGLKTPFALTVSRQEVEGYVPGGEQEYKRRAEAIFNDGFSLLGFENIRIGSLNWHQDPRSGIAWPMAYYADIDTLDLGRPSDVKYPWEISRLQWLIPLGQAYCLTGDEKYAVFVYQTLEDWIETNPCTWGVNWACTMEPAMRVFSLVWFYRIFSGAPCWANKTNFLHKILRTVYLHLYFIRKNMELTDINGNHLTAEAAALVVGGCFFGKGVPVRWGKLGWKILQREIKLQIYADGVNFEGSTAYHRLAGELFFIAAAFMEEQGHNIPEFYRKRMLGVANFVDSYTMPNGLSPNIGDADDGRVLPFGRQNIRDHRYLSKLIFARWGDGHVPASWRQSAEECLWWWGAAPYTEYPIQEDVVVSSAFRESGCYILRSGRDYTYIECGPIGLGGRGGHGHNDSLSIEVILNGQHLIVDPGCPDYTGNYVRRNLFRATAVHNTPRICNGEINRFVFPTDLWSLHDDANCRVKHWLDDDKVVSFVGSHNGFRRYGRHITVTRRIAMEKSLHAIVWTDSIASATPCAMCNPLQLASDVKIDVIGDHHVVLVADGQPFVLYWASSAAPNFVVEDSIVSPSYGLMVDALRLLWSLPESTEAVISYYLYPGSELDDSIHLRLSSICESLRAISC